MLHACNRKAKGLGKNPLYKQALVPLQALFDCWLPPSRLVCIYFVHSSLSLSPSWILSGRVQMHIARIATSLQAHQKHVKQEANIKKRRKDSVLDDDMDTDALDWWTKYFASLEALIEVGFFSRVYPYV